MSESPSQDIDRLVQNYQNTNKVLRNRAIILSILFLIIVGLMHSVRKSKSKKRELLEAKEALQAIVASDSLDATLDTMDFFARERLGQDARFEKAKYEFARSGYTDKTQLYDLIVKYDEEIKALGLKSGDYQISILGMSTSFADWLYYAPIILLLLYHDMTVIYLYRKSLRSKMESVGIERWKLGPEIFGSEHEPSEIPTNRFIRFFTTFFIIALLFLPIIPAFVGAIFYINENAETDLRALMIIIQWICPAVMIIDMLLIYHSENFLGMKTIGSIVGKIVSKMPTRGLILAERIYYVFLILIFPAIIFCVKNEFNGLITFTVIATASPLLFASPLLIRYPGNPWIRAMRVLGRAMFFYWTMSWVTFFIYDMNRVPKEYLTYPHDIWDDGAWATFGVLAMLACIYAWIFSKRTTES